MTVIAFVRPNGQWDTKPATLKELREMYCNQWDSCSPCPYCGSHSRTGGGFDCGHPLNVQPHPGVQIGGEGVTTLIKSEAE